MAAVVDDSGITPRTVQKWPTANSLLLHSTQRHPVTESRPQRKHPKTPLYSVTGRDPPALPRQKDKERGERPTRARPNKSINLRAIKRLRIKCDRRTFLIAKSSNKFTIKVVKRVVFVVVF